MTANKILENLKDKKIGVFCDDSNLYHSYQKCGWRIDFEKFKDFLAKFCQVEFINYYIAIPEKSDANYQKTERFLEKIKNTAIIKSKPLKYTPAVGKFVKKGDMDVEIVLDTVRFIESLDVAIILSGDSDLLELKNIS